MSTKIILIAILMVISIFAFALGQVGTSVLNSSTSAPEGAPTSETVPVAPEVSADVARAFAIVSGKTLAATESDSVAAGGVPVAPQGPPIEPQGPPTLPESVPVPEESVPVAASGSELTDASEQESSDGVEVPELEEGSGLGGKIADIYVKEGESLPDLSQEDQGPPNQVIMAAPITV